MKRNDTNIKKRVIRCERMICDLHDMTPDEYLELLYETGCEFVEKLFIKEGYQGKSLKHIVRRYITSNVFWYYWIIEWVNTCEIYLDWDNPNKSIDHLIDMQRQTKRPWLLLHDKIVKEERLRQNAEAL